MITKGIRDSEEVTPVQPVRSARWEKHLRLQELSYHPSGTWTPIGNQSTPQSIPERFSAMAALFPERLAIFDHEESLTYGELEMASSRVASAVLEKIGSLSSPGKAEQVGGAIAVLAELEVTAVIALLAVLKAGQIYVGLEPSFPEKHSQHILEDTGARLILAGPGYLETAHRLAKSGGLAVIDLAGLPPAKPSPTQAEERAALPLISPEAPATIFYTTGSTGVPKGVFFTHRDAFGRVVTYNNFYHVSDADRIACFEPLAFSGGFWITFGPLCNGAAVGVFNLQRFGLAQLLTWLETHQPTISGALAFSHAITTNNLDVQFPAMRLINLGGGAYFRKDAEELKRVFPQAIIVTGLGMTEAGRVAEIFLDSPFDEEDDILPLGYPTPGVMIKLLSADGQEVAPGEIGEIAVEGGFMASGYWGRPELTRSKFCPPGTLGAGRVYRTGDLGQWTADGCLVHRGRVDFMVKIRGYQVFTNEIEAIIGRAPGVKQVVVLVQRAALGEQRLVAYLAIDESHFPGIPALYALFDELPRHMRPNSFQTMARLPKTANGKVKRDRLTPPPASRLGVTADYVAPRDATEMTLAAIWSEILGVPAIGIHDNFLDLGGESLQATRIVNLTIDILDVQTSLVDFFDTLTIAEMAAVIQTRRDADNDL